MADTLCCVAALPQLKNRFGDITCKGRDVGMPHRKGMIREALELRRELAIFKRDHPNVNIGVDIIDHEIYSYVDPTWADEFQDLLPADAQLLGDPLLF
jgi:hypothetical protein